MTACTRRIPEAVDICMSILDRRAMDDARTLALREAEMAAVQRCVIRSVAPGEVRRAVGKDKKPRAKGFLSQSMSEFVKSSQQCTAEYQRAEEEIREVERKKREAEEERERAILAWKKDVEKFHTECLSRRKANADEEDAARKTIAAALKKILDDEAQRKREIELKLKEEKERKERQEQEALRKKREEEEAKQRQLEQTKKRSLEPEGPTLPPPLPDFGTPATPNQQANTVDSAEPLRTDTETRLKELENKYKSIDDTLDELKKKNDQTSKTMEDIETNIGMEINKITTSLQNCQSAFTNIYKTFKTATLGEHKAELLYLCMRTYARKLLQQKSHALYGNGCIVLHLSHFYSDFIDVIQYVFWRNCSFTIPMAIADKDPKVGSRTEKDTLHKWVERVATRAFAYGAVLQSTYCAAFIPGTLKPPSKAPCPDYRPILWTLMASIANLPQEEWTKNTAAWAHALNALLESSGYELLRTYKFQFAKLLNVLEAEVVNKSIAGVRESAPPEEQGVIDTALAKLRRFFNDARAGNLSPPEGKVLAQSTGQSGA